MIQSMTAFARAESAGDFGSAVCEIRSINHRFLEVSLFLPESLRVLEMPIRELIKQAIKRGKIECAIRYRPQGHIGSLLTVNTPLAQELSYACDKVTQLFNNPAPISPLDVLRWPGIFETPEADVDVLQAEVTALIKKTLQDLVAARTREGEELKQLFLQRMNLMRNELTKVRSHIPMVLQEQRERLIKRLQEAQLELNPERVEQEIVLFAQRIDVTEEIERTETHITEIRRVLKEGGMVGRRLDFLLQELNREANTMGSKSVNSEITHAAVELKVLIEQVREQVQNIE